MNKFHSKYYILKYISNNTLKKCSSLLFHFNNQSKLKKEFFKY